MLAVNKILDHARLQRAGTIKRDQGNHVVEAVWFEFTDQLLDATGFQLENGGSVALAEQAVHLFVIERQIGDVDVLAFLLIDGFYRPIDDGQRAQSEEVEFHQPGRFHIVLVVLGKQAGACAFVVAVERREVGKPGLARSPRRRHGGRHCG